MAARVRKRNSFNPLFIRSIFQTTGKEFTDYLIKKFQSLINQVYLSDLMEYGVYCIFCKWFQSLINQVHLSDSKGLKVLPKLIKKFQSLINQVYLSDIGILDMKRDLERVSIPY